jgi:XTP/dITP diphosphohydrolase
MARIERALSGMHDRSACFICALCLAWPDGQHEIFEGRVDGDLVWPPRGSRGFGYDPVFRPRGYEMTFGEMEPRSKHAMSHRARAFEKLLAEAMDHD